MRSMLAALILIIAASVRTFAADAPPADPVLAEASDLAGTVMFFDLALRVWCCDRARRPKPCLGYGETEKGNGRTPDGKAAFSD